MSSTLRLCILGAMLLVMGCAANQRNASAGARLRSSLLFDRIPGDTYATDIPFRRAWPTADGGVFVRETISFTEQIRDRQGYGGDDASRLNRRFTTRRHGVIVR